MNHIEYELLYHLAELAENEEPFNDEETEAMRHIAECKDCYKKFCILESIVSMTNDTGYIAVSEGLKQKLEQVEDENQEKLQTIISVSYKKVKETITVFMEQLKGERGLFEFDEAVAFAARGIDGDSEKNYIKMEDADNVNNQIYYYPDSGELFIRIEKSKDNNNGFFALLVYDTGEKNRVDLEGKGSFWETKVKVVQGKDFRIFIEQK